MTSAYIRSERERAILQYQLHNRVGTLPTFRPDALVFSRANVLTGATFALKKTRASGRNIGKVPTLLWSWYWRTILSHAWASWKALTSYIVKLFKVGSTVMEALRCVPPHHTQHKSTVAVFMHYNSHKRVKRCKVMLRIHHWWSCNTGVLRVVARLQLTTPHELCQGA